MIQNIVFDMSRVLMEFNTVRYARLAGVPEADLEQFRQAVYRSPEWLSIEDNSLTPEKAAAKMCSKLPERLHPCVNKTVSDWWKEPIIPIAGMADLVKELKRNGYRLYLLSNARKEADQFFKTVPGSEYFDGILFSHMVSLLKPQPAIFQQLYSRFTLDPATCVFIDDVSANIEAGKNTGMRGIVFTGDAKQLRKDLLKMGVSVAQ